MVRLALACLASLALLAAGCGGDDSGDSGGGGGGGQGGGPVAATKVAMKDIQFAPKDITVKKGATVTWTNNDSAAHDVTKQSGPGPDFSSGTGDLKKGDTYKQTLKTAGTIEYVCKVHPGMEGTVQVK